MHIISSPIGNLAITLNQNQLSRIEFFGDQGTISPSSNNSALNKIIIEIHSYFKNPKHAFAIPLELKGTSFQQKVWESLRNIHVGQTLSYGELATQLNTSPRAIGNACRSNPVPLIIPCHRIIAKNSLGGFSGKASGSLVEIKKWLLQHEA